MHCLILNALRKSLFAAFVILVLSAPARAADYINSEKPAPANVEEDLSPIEDAFPERRRLRSYFPGLKKRLEGADPFWRDTELLLHPRVYYFDREREPGDDSRALAYGGWLSYSSGWWRDFIKVNTVIYTSQRGYGPEEYDGTLLLKPGQKGFWVLGQANVEIRLAENISAKLYRQAFSLPYLNRHDNRMVPNTFEAYTLQKQSGGGKLGLIASQVTRIKTRNSDKFVSMSEAAGFDGTDEPLTVAGFRYNFTEKTNVGAVNQYSWNFMNTLYAEANSVWRYNNDLSLRFGAQYTRQRSVGNELGGRFDTYVYGGKVSGSYRNSIFTFAFSSTSDDHRIRNPYGGYPGYLSLMIKNFTRASEDAWLVGASYDFSRVGLPGLSGFVNYAQGNTPDSGPNASPDQTEFDLTIDYHFQKGRFEGLWLRARAAFVDQDDRMNGATDVTNIRLILNYDLPVL